VGIVWASLWASPWLDVGIVVGETEVPDPCLACGIESGSMM
jgi:hypothetical protein